MMLSEKSIYLQAHDKFFLEDLTIKSHVLTNVNLFILIKVYTDLLLFAMVTVVFQKLPGDSKILFLKQDPA